MIYLKETPIGIDTQIQRLQKGLYNKLPYIPKKGYGRCYIIESEKKKIPVHFLKGKDYQEVLICDDLAISFFFLENEMSKVNKYQFETKIDIIFQIDLSKISPTIQHRSDEEIRIEILKIISKESYFTLEEVTKGQDAIKEFYSDLLDMQPYHFLKFSGILKYHINQC